MADAAGLPYRPKVPRELHVMSPERSFVFSSKYFHLKHAILIFLCFIDDDMKKCWSN